MDHDLQKKFDECELYISRLKMQNQNARYNIKKCARGELCDEYLKSCDLEEKHIKKMEKELQELKRCLTLLER